MFVLNTHTHKKKMPSVQIPVLMCSHLQIRLCKMGGGGNKDQTETSNYSKPTHSSGFISIHSLGIQAIAPSPCDRKKPTKSICRIRGNANSFISVGVITALLLFLRPQTSAHLSQSVLLESSYSEKYFSSIEIQFAAQVKTQ